MALPLPPNYNDPIPNSPFYYPNEEALASSTGPLIVGAGLAVDYASGQLQAAGGGIANIIATLPLYKTGTASNPVLNIEVANYTRLGAVQVGKNIEISGVGVIGVPDSTTQQRGAVQLFDGTSSTSKFLALTANQGHLLQKQIDSLVITTDLHFAGTFDPVTAQMVTVTVKGGEVGFVVGANLPIAEIGNEGYFVIITERGIYTPPGSGTPIDAHVGSWFLSNGTSWNYIKINEQLPYASETVAGIVRLATTLEALDGTDDTTAITPLKLAQAAIPQTEFTAKGDLLVASGSGASSALPVGPDDSTLIADSACPEGVKWSTTAGSAIPCSVIPNCGAIVAGSGPATPSALPLGANNTFLRVNYSCPLGLEWICVPAAFAIPCCVLSSAGAIIVAESQNVPAALPKGTAGQVLTICPGDGISGVSWQDPAGGAIEQQFAVSCKGALAFSDGTGGIAYTCNYYNNRNSVLRAYGSQWTDPLRGTVYWDCTQFYVATCELGIQHGALAVGYGSGEGNPNPSLNPTYCILDPGTENQILRVAINSPTGLEWQDFPTITSVNEDITGGTCNLDNGNQAVFPILPRNIYPAGRWQINIWGWTCSSTSGKGYYYLRSADCTTFVGPSQLWWHPNTESRLPNSMTWVVDNTNFDLCLDVVSDNNKQFDYCLLYSAIRLADMQ